MRDSSFESLLSQIKGDTQAYRRMTLGDLVLDMAYISTKEPTLTNEFKNAIFISRFPFYSQGGGMRLRSSTDMSRVENVARRELLKELGLDKVKTSKNENTDSSWKNEWYVAALELDSDIILNDYFQYLLTRTVGKIMAQPIIDYNSSPAVMQEKILSMQVLVPSILDQENTLKIREEIDKRRDELERLKKLLLEVTQHDKIEKELRKIKSNQELADKVGISRSLQQLLEHNEDSMLEFKASMWTKYKTVNKISTQEIVETGGKAYHLQDEVLHTVAAFLNTEGGTLLIGVKDKPTSWRNKPAEVYGVGPDYRFLGKNNQDGDGYILAVYQVLNNGFGDTSTTTKYVNVKIEIYNGKEICRIDVKPLPRILNGELYIKEKTGQKGDEAFYYRAGPSSQKASIQSAARYIRDNFPGFSGSNIQE